MHRAARDGISSLVPKNCRPVKGDILILSFGDIDCRAHIAKQAHQQGTSTATQVDLLTARIGHEISRFEKKCEATLAFCCILPPNHIDLPCEFYGSKDECLEDAKLIRDRMNNNLKHILPLIDFRSHFTDQDGLLDVHRSDKSVHIDSREAAPIAKALNSFFGTTYTTVSPPWPNPSPAAQPAYISPLKKMRRDVKAKIFQILRAI